MPAFGDAAALLQPVQPGGHVGDQPDRLFKRHHLVLAHAVAEQRRRVDRAAHHVEMRACVRAADHRVPVLPHLGARLPVRLVVAERPRREPGSQLVGDHDVEQRVERLFASGLGDLSDGAAGRVGVLWGESLDEDQPFPIGKAAKDSGLLRVGTLVEPSAHLRIGERPHALGHRQVHGLPPAGQPVEHKAGQERQPDLRRVRQRERDDAAASFRGDFRCAQLLFVAFGVARRDAKDVPVQRPVGGPRHVGEQRDVVVGEARKAAGDDRLELGARVLVNGRRQRQEFLARRAARRHRLTLAVVVGVRLRRRQTERTVGQRGTEQRGHLLDLLGRRLAADRVVAHRRQPNRTVAHQEAGVDGRAPVEPCQPIAERRPLPVKTSAQRVERHALDPRQHPGEVVLLVGPGGRQREAAVAAEHRGDAVLHRRARGRVPEQLGVVVRVQVDEARRERLPLRVNGFRGLFVDCRRPRRSARRAPPHHRDGRARLCRRRSRRLGSAGRACQPRRRRAAGGGTALRR